MVDAGYSVDGVEPARWEQAIDEVMGRVTGAFGRVEPRRTARAYVAGLLSGIERKNCWWLAENAGHARPDAMQRLLWAACWDAEAVRDHPHPAAPPDPHRRRPMGGVCGHAEDVRVSRADLHDEEAGQELEGHRAVHVDEVASQHRRCLGRNCRHVRSICRGGAGGIRGGIEDPADRRGADPVTEASAVYPESSGTPTSGSPSRGARSA